MRACFSKTKTPAKFADHLTNKNLVFNVVCNLSVMRQLELNAYTVKIDVGGIWGLSRRISTPGDHQPSQRKRFY